MYPKEILWIGAKGGLVSRKHRTRMGESIWLFLWFLTRQTDLNEAGEGVVYYGRPISFREISSDTQFPTSTLHRWCGLLVEQDYIRMEEVINKGSIFWVCNGKNKSKRRSTYGTPTVPRTERQRSTYGTENPAKPLATQEVNENATIIASKSLYYNTTAAAKTAADYPSSIESQKQELRRRGLLQ